MTRTCEEIKGFVHCTINFFHRFMIVSTAISFGLINRGITRFKAAGLLMVGPGGLMVGHRP